MGSDPDWESHLVGRITDKLGSVIEGIARVVQKETESTMVQKEILKELQKMNRYLVRIDSKLNRM
jgi:hypothetical protein